MTLAETGLERGGLRLRLLPRLLGRLLLDVGLWDFASFNFNVTWLLPAARDASAVLLLRSTHLGLHIQTAISNFNYAYQGLVWCVKYLLFFVEVPC